LVLLAPSANAMRCMLRICDAQFKVVFSDSKIQVSMLPPQWHNEARNTSRLLMLTVISNSV